MTEEKYVKLSDLEGKLPVLDAGGEGAILLSDFRRAVALVATSEAPPIRKGEWHPVYKSHVDDYDRELEPKFVGWGCSLCGHIEMNKEPYCHCGAKMEA